MSHDRIPPDETAAAVRRALSARGVIAFEILERVHVPGTAVGNTAVLVRFPDAQPEVLIVDAPPPAWRKAADPVGILREALHDYEHLRRETERLLERFERERNRSEIERVLRKSAAGELSRREAAQALNVSLIELVKLEWEFKIDGHPQMVSGAEDVLHDIERVDAKHRAERLQGRIPSIDLDSIQRLRKLVDWDDEKIRKHLGLPEGTKIPTPEEIELDGDVRFYGIDPAAPVGVTATVHVGTRNTKIVVEATDGVVLRKVSAPTRAGKDLGEYVSEALDRVTLGITKPRR